MRLTLGVATCDAVIHVCSLARREAGEEEDDEIGRLLDDPNVNPAQVAEKAMPSFQYCRPMGL